MKRENVVTCSPCGKNVALATKRGFFNKGTFFTTPHRPYGALPPQGGQLTTHGFTLIELLVVVLIIGILAAVAVPQYQKAVEKAHFTEAITQLKALANAEKIYFLANDAWATNWSDLDISFEGTPDRFSLNQNQWYLSLDNLATIDEGGPRVYAGRKGVTKGNGRWYIVYNLSDDTMWCSGATGDTKASKICKTFGSTEIECPWSSEGFCYQLN